MKLNPAITAMVENGLSCAHCTKLYFPNRKQASKYLLYPGKYGYCSAYCGSVSSLKVAGIVSSERNRQMLTGIERDPTSSTGKQEHHCMAKFYCIESPDRKRYIFRNLKHFVRCNPQLFPSQCVVWHGSLRDSKCSALSGLASLFKKSDQRETWRGWRAVWLKDRLGRIVWEKS